MAKKVNIRWLAHAELSAAHAAYVVATRTACTDPKTEQMLVEPVTDINNRYDVVNMTVGLHAQLGELTHLEVGAVLPLDDAPDRFFDTEFQIFLNRLY